MDSFDRYTSFRDEGKISIVPFIEIQKKNSDKYIRYNRLTTRLDKVSYEYYNNPDYAWLILQANPELGSIENFIPDNALVRIPYPLDETLNLYLNEIVKYNELNG